MADAGRKRPQGAELGGAQLVKELMMHCGDPLQGGAQRRGRIEK